MYGSKVVDGRWLYSLRNKLDAPRSAVSGNSFRKRKPTVLILGNALKHFAQMPISNVFAVIRTDVLVDDERDLNEAVSSNRNTNKKW